MPPYFFQLPPLPLRHFRCRQIRLFSLALELSRRFHAPTPRHYAD
jgi:hypothetical protein